MTGKIEYITEAINKIVFEWTTKFYYYTYYVDKENSIYKYIIFENIFDLTR